MVVNESFWLPGPYDKRGRAKPVEEGKEIINCTVGVQGISICVGNGIQCLHRTF